MKALYALVGQHHRGMGKFVHHLPDRTPVTLRREPTNQFDPNAVQVWVEVNGEGQQIGYVKGKQAGDLARKMDASGKPEVGVAWSGALIDNASQHPQIEVEESDAR